jgi:zinc transport system permease protein
MFDDFFVRAIAGGLGVALVAGPLGCFIVWRRMAYFGDALAHAGLLGVALGLLAGAGPTAGVVAVAVLAALALFGLERLRLIAGDTLLGIVSHSALAVGLVVLALMSQLRVDLMAYLFGDVLAVSRTDLVVIWGAGAAVIATLVLIWRPLVAGTVDPDIARAEGLPADRARLAFMLMIALTVAIAMKIVGVILVTSLLIIPAATVRRLAGSPEAMAILAAAAGAGAVLVGLTASLYLDTPSGPSIVVAAALGFVISLAVAPLAKMG